MELLILFLNVYQNYKTIKVLIKSIVHLLLGMGSKIPQKTHNRDYRLLEPISLVIVPL